MQLTFNRGLTLIGFRTTGPLASGEMVWLMEQKIPGTSKNFRETDNRLSIYLILYRKFRLIVPLKFGKHVR